MPQAAIHHQHGPRLAGDGYFVGMRFEGWYAIVAAGIVALAMRLRDNPRSGLCRKGRQHPDRRHVHERVGIRRWHVPGVLLIERPVGVQRAARIARMRHHASGVRDAHVLAQKRFTQAQQPRLRQIGNKGLVEVDQSRHLVELTAGIRQLVGGDRGEDAVSHLRHRLGWDHRVDHAPAVFGDAALHFALGHSSTSNAKSLAQRRRKRNMKELPSSNCMRSPPRHATW